MARICYVLAILQGLKAGFPDITTLDTADVQRHAQLCLTFEWLPESVRTLLREGVNCT